ncbi:hypothetical protein [Seinonella peptonophila]|nr:hypothetical protein [Seinonella peptonophila]
MENREMTMKQLTEMINSVMGQQVLSEDQFKQIMDGAAKARDHGGMGAVLEFLMKVTQADVDFQELEQFANQVQTNPQMGLDILKGEKKAPAVKKKKKRSGKRTKEK